MHGQKIYKLGLQKMSNKIEILDDFLNEKDLIKLEKIIDNSYFPWYFQESQTDSGNDNSWFSHILYDFDAPNPGTDSDRSIPSNKEQVSLDTLNESPLGSDAQFVDIIPTPVKSLPVYLVEALT